MAVDPEEARQVRAGAGVFVLAELGVLAVRGEDRASWLNGMVSVDVPKIGLGERREGLFCSVKGRVLALADVWPVADALQVVTHRDRIPVLLEALEKLIVMEDVTLADESASWAIVSVQGERAREVAAAASGVTQAFADRTGSSGVDLVVPADARDGVVDALVAAGGHRASAELLDALRLEAALPRWGVDVTDELLPQEARLEQRRVDFQKGCYVGQEVVMRLEMRGHANRILTPVDLADAEPPAPGAPVRVGDAEVGRITSAARGPTVGRTIALALLRRELTPPGTALVVDGRPARVAENPWVRGA